MKPEDICQYDPIKHGQHSGIIWEQAKHSIDPERSTWTSEKLENYHKSRWVRCPLCGKRLHLIVKDCGDGGCFHMSLPPHKRKGASKKKKTSKVEKMKKSYRSQR